MKEMNEEKKTSSGMQCLFDGYAETLLHTNRFHSKHGGFFDIQTTNRVKIRGETGQEDNKSMCDIIDKN
jgi:hypothetical protein